ICCKAWQGRNCKRDELRYDERKDACDREVREHKSSHGFCSRKQQDGKNAHLPFDDQANVSRSSMRPRDPSTTLSALFATSSVTTVSYMEVELPKSPAHLPLRTPPS